MRTFFLFLSLFFLVSCKSYVPYQIKEGTFRYSFKRGTVLRELILNSDSTFVITSKVYGFKSSCSGKWKYISPDTIFIACPQPKCFLEAIESGYMSERERKIKVINKRKLRLPLDEKLHSKPSVILKRVK